MIYSHLAFSRLVTEKLYTAEIQTQQANIETELKTVDAKYHIMRESEIAALSEISLNKFADKYYSTC